MFAATVTRREELRGDASPGVAEADPLGAAPPPEVDPVDAPFSARSPAASVKATRTWPVRRRRVVKA
jgi:hypothetical protein